MTVRHVHTAGQASSGTPAPASCIKKDLNDLDRRGGTDKPVMCATGSASVMTRNTQSSIVETLLVEVN